MCSRADLMGKVKCISHSEDVDGLVCASLLRMVKGAEFILTDYVNLERELESIPENAREVYICDLSLREELLGELRRIRKSSDLTYIDHHPFQGQVFERLKEMGVEMVHSTEKCAGMLTYQLFEKELPKEAAFMTACAVTSDYPSSSKEVSLFIERFDPQLLAFESTLLNYAIARDLEDKGFKNVIVKGLSRPKMPHEIPKVLEYAQEHIDYIFDNLKNADKRLRYGKNLAYIQVSGTTTLLANSLVRVAEKPTIICYSKYRDGERYRFSIRSRERKYDLGRLVSKIAVQLGGIGGGHPLAAGAQLPAKSVESFIKELDTALEQYHKFSQYEAGEVDKLL